jgi:hypothetical protein
MSLSEILVRRRKMVLDVNERGERHINIAISNALNSIHWIQV